MQGKRIAVIGAGIAGLTAALCFARKGAAVTIIEQAGRLSPVGAGLQISPNATAILDALGVLPAVEAVWHEPEDIALVSGRDLTRLARVPAGAYARQVWGAPYGVLNRSILQQALLDAVRATPGCRLVLDQRIETSTTVDMRHAVAAIVGGEADLVIGADGVWSQLRRLVPGHGQARFTGYVAWRMVLSASALPRLIDPAGTIAFLGPATHLVAYPLKANGTVNLVAIMAGRHPAPEGSGTAEATKTPPDLRHAFKGWHPQIIAMMERAEECTQWPIYEVGDGRWSDGAKLVLIGDAAHAMMPFAAQGAAMAIEDAFELAEDCARGADWTVAIQGFEARRRARIAQVRSRTAFNRFAYHARGPFRLGRDIVLSLRSPESLAGDLDWLYGYRAPGLPPLTRRIR